jgi:hypothetical protein
LSSRGYVGRKRVTGLMMRPTENTEYSRDADVAGGSLDPSSAKWARR